MSEKETKKTEEVVKRTLTSKEIGQIRKYNLMSVVESAVIEVWRKQPARKESSLAKNILFYGIAVIIAAIAMVIVYSLPIVLWIKFLTPQNQHLINWFGKDYNYYLNGILRVYEFGLWVIVSVCLAAGSYNLYSDVIDGDKVFHKSNLDTWKTRIGLGKIMRFILFISVIIGFVVNAYFVLPGLLLATFIVYSIIDWVTKVTVQEKMDKIIKEAELATEKK